MAHTDYLKLLRRYWALVLLLSFLGTAVGAAVWVVQPPVYSSSARVFVSVRSGQTTSDLAQGDSYSQSRVASYASLAGSQRVLDQVADDLGLSEGIQRLQERIRASIVPETTIIELTATAGEAAAAVALADAVAAELAETVADIEARPGLASPVRLETIQEALIPREPDAPRPEVLLGLGALAGLLLGTAIALLRQAGDTRLRSESDLREVTDAPLLGVITFDPQAKRRPLIVHADPRSAKAEAFRALRTSMQFVRLDGARTFVLTSTMPGDGKSTTAANAALAFADAGRSVVLVDADLRKPRAAEYLGLDGTVGLTDVLVGDVELGDALQPWGGTTLSLLPAGQIPPNPSELLGSDAMAALLASLSDEFDVVLVDAPPLLPVTDAAVLARHGCAPIVVAAAGSTTKHQLSAAMHVLRTVGAEAAGIVLTKVPARGADVYAAAYYGATAHRIKPADTLVAVTEAVAPAPAGAMRESIASAGASTDQGSPQGGMPEPPVPIRSVGGKRSGRRR